MPVSEVDICNVSLGLLGADKIMDLADSDDCAINYPMCRDAALEDVDWSFAIERFSNGSPDTTPPAYGYAYRFLLPTRVIRVIEVNGNLYDWERESNYIITDQSSIEYRAVIRVTDVRLFSPSFTQMLAFRLAATISIPITNSASLGEKMWQMYAALKFSAQGNDGRQGTTKTIRRGKTMRSRTS